MADLSLRHVYKVYPNGVKAVNDFTMDINDKEFIVFVGPSGCGKSTTLRMIAGLEDITAGEIYIGDELVNDSEPKDRDIAMVFQNYALYPHMTVYDNMAFGLKLRHVPAEEIHKKVLWAADILKLTEYLDRKPRAMSGGQRQRVALGRAILRNPKVFLLDEPLSNLDAKLRTEMRAEITKLHQKLNTTFIYVTHDQVEAMTMGTRIVVMKLGYIQQIDTPNNLYRYPANKFVAGFIGTPQMNFFEATLLRTGNDVKVKFLDCDNELVVPFNELIKVRPSYLDGKHVVVVGLRCENISLDEEILAKSKNKVKVKVSHFEELGNETLVYGDMDMNGDGFSETDTRVIIKSFRGQLGLKVGEVVEAAFDMSFASFFDKTSELTISPRIPNENVFDCDISHNTVNFVGVSLKLPPAIKVADTKGAFLFIPTKALSVVGSGKGDIKAIVEKTENIEDTKLCYLKIEDRTFFAIVNKDYKEGEVVELSIDYKDVSIVKNDETLVSPLPKRDTFIGSFSNLQSIDKSLSSVIKDSQHVLKEKISELKLLEKEELNKIVVTPQRLVDIKKAYKDGLTKASQDRSYKLGTKDFGKEGRKKANIEYKETLATLLAKYNEDVAKYNRDLIAQNNLSEEDKLKVENKKEKIRIKYASQIKSLEEEAQNFAQELLSGKHHAKDIAKKLEPELMAEYVETANKLFADYQAEISKISAISATTIDEIRDIKAQKKYQKNVYEKKLAEAGLKSKLFFMNINGYFVRSPYEITRKVIQALGISLFLTTYRYDLSHYSYIVDDPNGFEATVVETLDYGKEKFVKCISNGKTIYVNYDKILTSGTHIKLGFKPEDIELFENKFNIRLY